MSRRLKILLALLAALILSLIAFYVSTHIEFYQHTIKHGPSPEAQKNRYLAAELFLRKQGLQVSQAQNLDAINAQPPSGPHSLVYLAPRDDLSERQSQKLLSWAKQGGHLLFVAEALWDEETQQSGDLLLDAIGIQQFSYEVPGQETEGDDHQDATQQPSQDPDAKTPQASSKDLTRLQLSNEPAPAYAAFDPDYHLVDPQQRAHLSAQSEHATHVLQLRYGQGRITVVSDPWIWRNKNIKAYDHAWLLWYLTQDTHVTFIQHAEYPSLLELLLRHFTQALVVLGLLLVAGLWYFAMRHGPLQSTPPSHRRQLQEHLRGNADFMLRHDGSRHFVSQLQQEILRVARKRYPGFEHLAEQAQQQVLSRLSQQPLERIQQIMQPPGEPALGPVSFTRQVAHLQTLRNAL